MIKFQHNRKSLFGISAATVSSVLALATSTAAYGQSTDQEPANARGSMSSDAGSGVIVVTARKREKTLIDAPLSIQPLRPRISRIAA